MFLSFFSTPSRFMDGRSVLRWLRAREPSGFYAMASHSSRSEYNISNWRAKTSKKKCCFFSGLVDQRQGDEAGRKEKKFIHSAQCGEKKIINPSGEMRDRLLLSNDVETTFCTRPIASIEIDHRVSSQLRGLLYQTHSLAGRSRSVARSVCSAFSAPNICSSRARLLSCA